MSKNVTIMTGSGEVYVDTSADPGEWPDCPACGGAVVRDEGDDEDLHCSACGQAIWLDIKIIGYSYVPGDIHSRWKGETP